MPQPGLRGGLISSEATAGRAVTVDDGRRGGIGIAPHGKTHVAIIANLETSRAQRRIH
jgi:hypothetical protein